MAVSCTVRLFCWATSAMELTAKVQERVLTSAEVLDPSGRSMGLDKMRKTMTIQVERGVERWPLDGRSTK
jgi:hypothetical protein